MLGVPGPTVAVGVLFTAVVPVALAAAVAVGFAPGLAVAVVVAVVVGVGDGAAPSSRKTIDGLLHQRSCASANSDGVGLAVGVGVPPPNKPVHETSNKFDRSRPIARQNPASFFNARKLIR